MEVRHFIETDDFTKEEYLEMLKVIRTLKDAERIRITEIPRRSDNKPVSADADMEDLIDKVLNQNFVPVLDDQRNFIGIITRKDVIRYLCQKAGELGKRQLKVSGS